MEPSDVPYTAATDINRSSNRNYIVPQNIIKSKPTISSSSSRDSGSDAGESSSSSSSKESGVTIELSEVQSTTNTTTTSSTTTGPTPATGAHTVGGTNTVRNKLRPHANAATMRTNESRTTTKTMAAFLKTTRQHVYSKWEKKQMKNYTSIDYRNPRSEIYQQFITTTDISNSVLWKWTLFIIIGVLVAVTAFTLKIVTEEIHEAVAHKLLEFFLEHEMTKAYLWNVGISLALILVGSSMVIWLEPNAAGSGIPEVIGYLNGVHVSNIFTPRVYFTKVISVICAVASGLPLGPEGPMIHIGGTIGASVESKNPILRKIVPWYHFRNQEDKRNFVLGGVASGVAAAFNAPIGGLAFAWEEISTFWDGKTAWMILFCCMLSAFGTNLLLSFFADSAGSFTRSTILFSVPAVDYVGVWIFLPAIIIGLVGGILGIFFSWIALGTGKLRKRFIKHNILRLAEPVIIVILFSTVGFYLPYAFECTPNPSYANYTIGELNTTEPLSASLEEDVHIAQWICPEGYYNDMAQLTLNPGHKIIRILLQHDNLNYLNFTTLIAFLCYYFLFAAWCAGGLSLSSGIVVPMITIGAIYGRIIGKIMLYITPLNEFNIPGLYALLGSASFFAGVTRNSISLTIIMIELSGDVLLAFPLMVSIMVAKNFADSLVHPLYHEQLALKGVPYLDQPSSIEGLEKLRVSDVMTGTIVVLHEVESIRNIQTILEKYDFSSFPVISSDMNYKGMMSRSQIKALLTQKILFLKNPTDRPEKDLTWFEHKMLLNDKNIVKGPMLLDSSDLECFMDFTPYINTGVYSVPIDFSLKDAYELFRTLGLTHLMVINKKNELVGVITRKDLVGENIELKNKKKREKLKSKIKDAIAKSSKSSSRVFHSVLEN